MGRKKAKQSAVVSNKCFRLLRLKHEIQTDVKVLKAVVDEVDVLRLCRSLGMTMFNEGNRFSSHKFEFGQFNPSDYDADFARFIREKLVAGNDCNEEVDGKDPLQIGCLFGKQPEVKTELTRMGFWSSELDEGLSFLDQGVYCIEGYGDHRQLVFFAWLDSSLFEPNTIRDTPAYVLRFLVTLSSNITCCLSQEDFQRVKSDMDAEPDGLKVRWNSCSVAFNVKKQVEQNDSIVCGAVTRVSIPKFNSVKSVWFVGGVIPAVAVEDAVPSITELVSHNDTVPIADLAEWIMKKQKHFAVYLPPQRIQSTCIRDELLVRFGQSPDEELHKLRSKVDEHQEEANRRFKRESYEYAKKICDIAVRDARMLFAVRCPENSAQMDLVQSQYGDFLRQWEKCDFFRNMNYQDYKMLYLPERIQTHMKLLDDALQIDCSVFEERLHKVVFDDPFHTVIDSGGWGWGFVQKVIRRVFSRRNNGQFSSNLPLAMDDHQPRLEGIWMNAVDQLASKIQAATWEERVQQSTQDRGSQFDRDAEDVKMCFWSPS